MQANPTPQINESFFTKKGVPRRKSGRPRKYSSQASKTQIFLEPRLNMIIENIRFDILEKEHVRITKPELIVKILEDATYKIAKKKDWYKRID